MKKSDITLLISLMVIVTTIILLNCFASKTQGLLIKYVKNQVNSSINMVIDNTIRSILSEEQFNNIIEIEKNEEKEITNINFNNNKINRILSLSTNNILNEINKSNTKNYKIPFGVISKNHFFHNLGPTVPYQISILGQLNNNTYINIKEYGINNSKIEILLNIEIEYQILLAFAKETHKINKEIILESKIIQGNIPTYYGNVNSLLK